MSSQDGSTFRLLDLRSETKPPIAPNLDRVLTDRNPYDVPPVVLKLADEHSKTKGANTETIQPWSAKGLQRGALTQEIEDISGGASGTEHRRDTHGLVPNVRGPAWRGWEDQRTRKGWGSGGEPTSIASNGEARPEVVKKKRSGSNCSDDSRDRIPIGLISTSLR